MTDQSSQLHVLADVSRSLATFTDLDELVHYATRRIRELFEAEGCALLLLDEARREFTFPVASQRDAEATGATSLAAVRFPADRGIAGWVLKHDEPALVTDTAADTRFYADVDRRTAIRTQALLCAPLRTRAGNIGVIEVVNPGPGHLDPGDLEFLDILASEIGVAYEKAELYREVAREAIDLRRFCRGAGIGLALLGVIVAAAVGFYHRARVLPWSELPTQRGTLLAVLCVAVGAVLIAVGSGRVVPKAPRPQP